MKGVKKCFGLSLLLFIMVGLSLSVCSSDTNALRYKVTEIPIILPESGNNNILTNTYVGMLVEPFKLVSEYDMNTEDIYYGIYSDSNGECRMQNAPKKINHKTSSNDSTTLSWYGSYYPGWITPPSSASEQLLGLIRCNPKGAIPQPYSVSDAGMDGMSTASKARFESYLPYRFPYSGFYRQDSRENDSNGQVLGNRFGFDLILDEIPRSFNSMTIPLGVLSDAVEISAGTPITVSGQFWIHSNDDNYWQTGFTPGSDVSVKLVSQAVPYLQDLPLRTDCDFAFADENQEDGTVLGTFSYTCNILIPEGYTNQHLGFTLEFSGSPLWSFPVSPDYLVYDSSFITTDYDNTDSDIPATGEVVGGDIESAPGGAFPGTSAQPSWLESFLNAFNFSFANPFAGIFALFADNNTCANIPILAGMLHAENSIVCPWFDSNIRVILTPVLGLSAMMLVFGFAVRWLGSRSGNFIEDSGGVDSGGLHFQNKYRRSK